MFFKSLGMINLIMICFIIIGCNQNGKNTPTSNIYNEVLSSVLDSVKQRHKLKEKKIIIGRHENDKTLSFIIDDLKHEFKNDSVGPGTMVLSLANVLEDSIYVNITSTQSNYKIKPGWTNKKLDLAHRINISKDSDSVLLNLSKIILTPNEKMGCFYLSINSSGNPAGYIVFIYIDYGEDKWRVASVLKKWG